MAKLDKFRITNKIVNTSQNVTRLLKQLLTTKSKYARGPNKHFKSSKLWKGDCGKKLDKLRISNKIVDISQNVTRVLKIYWHLILNLPEAQITQTVEGRVWETCKNWELPPDRYKLITWPPGAKVFSHLEIITSLGRLLINLQNTSKSN